MFVNSFLWCQLYKVVEKKEDFVDCLSFRDLYLGALGLGLGLGLGFVIELYGSSPKWAIQ